MTDRREGRHLADLDARQREVATRPDGHLLVIAGPGAGKTRALTARIAHLVHARGVDPGTVVAFTFSRRAAAEVRSRVARLDERLHAPHSREAPEARPPGHEPVTAPVSEAGRLADRVAPPTGIWAGTIHAFGVRVLRRGGARHFERRPDFTVYDDDDTERTVRRVLADLGVLASRRARPKAGEGAPGAEAEGDRGEDPVTRVVRSISIAKRGGIGPASVEIDFDGTSFPEVFAAYEEALRVAQAFDFDDLVALATRSLEIDRPLRDRVRARVRHLLVDEYQDTDEAQVRMVEALDPDDLCVVADPEQSIYGFRGATPDVTGRFLDRWPGAAVVHLDRNYRSSGRIVAVAQRVRDAAPAPADGRTRLRQWTRNRAGDPVRTWGTSVPEREARLIATEIAGRLAAGTRPDEIAILVRTRAQLRAIESVLVELEDVPYEVVGGAPFFGREEVRDILAYLRVGASVEDAAAFWRIVNVPRRGLGPAAVLAIGREAISPHATSRSPEAALRRLATSDRIPDGAFDLIAVIDEVRARVAARLPLAETLRFIVDASAYPTYLDDVHPADATHRVARLATLASLAERYDDARRFLDDVALATSIDNPRPEGGRVRVSTIHAAKGTEYDHVYVAGCEEGTLPIARRPVEGPMPASAAGPGRPGGAAPDPEERRIFYVAVTRARVGLTLSHSSFRQARRVAPSRFLVEVGNDLVVRCEGGTSVPLVRARTRGTRAGPGGAPAPPGAAT